MNDLACVSILAGSLVILLLNSIKVKKLTNSRRKLVLFLLLYPFIVLVILLCVHLYVILVIYRAIISGILRKKYGDNFCGLVRGLDVLGASQTLQQNIITVAVIFETDSDRSSESIFTYFKEILEETVISHKTHLGKLFTTIKTFSGYKYLEKIDVKTDDCLRRLPTVDGELNDETFKQLLSRWYFEPFNGSLLWDVSLGFQPLKREGGASNKKLYPLILRIHHVMSDGITILKFFVGILSDKLNGSKPSTFQKYVNAEEVKFGTFFYYVQFLLAAVIYFPTALFSIVAIKSHDHNELHGKTLSNNEKVAYTLDECGMYFQKVKKIRKYTGASIPEIVLTAFSESLKEHFIKYHKSCPQEITITIPVVQNYTELQKIQPGLNTQDIQLANRFIIIFVKVPFIVTEEHDYNPNTPILSKLNAIRREVDIMKTTAEVPVSKMIFHHFFGTLPTSWIRYLSSRLNSTVCVSLIPGPPTITFGKGAFKTLDAIFWSPHLLGLDLMFGSLSYDNRLILSFNCDVVYISDQTVAQEVLEHTYKYVDLLEKELELHQQ